MVADPTMDVVQRAKLIYESELRARFEADHLHEFVAIEPDSREYFFGKTLSAAIQAARNAHPDRLAFALRVGHSTAVHLGVLES